MWICSVGRTVGGAVVRPRPLQSQQHCRDAELVRLHLEGVLQEQALGKALAVRPAGVREESFAAWAEVEVVREAQVATKRATAKAWKSFDRGRNNPGSRTGPQALLWGLGWQIRKAVRVWACAAPECCVRRGAGPSARATQDTGRRSDPLRAGVLRRQGARGRLPELEDVLRRADRLKEGRRRRDASRLLGGRR